MKMCAAVQEVDYTVLRRRRTSNIPPPLGRCSTASLLSLDDSSEGKEENQTQYPNNSRGFLRFDPINFNSTIRRNERMLSSMKSDVSAHNVTHFGSMVCFIPHQFHYTAAELEPYRLIGDPEMDNLLAFVANEGGCGAFDDVVAYSAKAYASHSSDDSEINVSPQVQFYRHYSEKVPSWVDFEQIQSGIDVFLAYLPTSACALYYRSLIGGFSIPQIVDVLISTRYLVPSGLVSDINKTKHQSVASSDVESTNHDTKRTLERLLDTGGFMACCFAPPPTNETQPAAALRPGGIGWEAALRVRVLHAKVRRSLLQSGKWDTKKNGVPINQEDMAATLLAFSVNVLLGIELIAGKPLPDNEQRDYLALWRYIGWLLGVDTPESDDLAIFTTSSQRNFSKHGAPLPIDPCGPRRPDISDSDGYSDSILHSYATLESMILHLLHPGEHSRKLVAHLLSIRGQDLFRSEVCRKFLGDPLSDDIYIARSSFHWGVWRREYFRDIIGHLGVRFSVYFVLVFMRCYILLTMSTPWIRERAIRFHASLQKRFLVHWEKNHAVRVGEAMNYGNEVKTNAKACPFSMLMTPKLE
jgi:hypothetical protein|mmetsp:Transcript_17122/g.37129  ORF Transcript_17122/g.37129 Transcript_17122/m.37129 type:complete len:583 (+) Transcript_17122:72-1820(+)